MKLVRLTSRSDGAVVASLKLNGGQEVEVAFTTELRGGIAVANPDQAIFDREPLDAATVRAIVAAVIAFDRVAAHSAAGLD